MFHAVKRSRLAWLGIGLLGGLVLGGQLPHTPLHAVATDKYDTFAVATGPVDESVEAIYFLDFLTGDLRAAVLGRRTGFIAYYYYNVNTDLGVEPAKNPRYLMVTGQADLRRGGGMIQPSLSVVYVAEITNGTVAAYAIPWSPNILAQNQVVKQPLVRVGLTRFRMAAPGGGGVAPPE